MARGKYGETLQAVEVNTDSIIGTVTNIGGAGDQVHALMDGDITFHFPAGDKTIAALEGSDWVAGPGCTGITSTTDVLIS